MTQQRKSLPDRPPIDETVYILGTGIAGCTIGWVLAEAGYHVTLIDQLDQPFSSTSIGALGIHLGGRYPRDWNTAKECLHSGIMLKRHMPFAFRNDTLRFLVADDSPIDFVSYVAFYCKLQDYYASLPREDQLFGSPKDFFNILDPNELANFTGISGGIETREGCFDMERVRSVLLETLRARNATFLLSTEVLAVNKTTDTEKRYDILVHNLKTNKKRTLKARTVINALGPNTRVIGQDFGVAPMSRLDLRFFQNVKIDKKTEAAYPFPFVVVPGYMHYIPLGNKKASLVGFSEIIETLQPAKGDTFTMPRSWRQQLLTRHVNDSHRRSAEIIKTARERFMPHLGEPILQDMYPGVAVSFNPEAHIKKQARIERTTGYPGYFSVNPTKASHVVWLALETLKYLVKDSIHAGKLTVVSPYVASILDGEPIAYVESRRTLSRSRSRRLVHHLANFGRK